MRFFSRVRLTLVSWRLVNPFNSEWDKNQQRTWRRDFVDTFMRSPDTKFRFIHKNGKRWFW